MRKFGRLALVAAAVLFGLSGLGAQAHADDCYYHAPVYKTIIVYETVEVPYVKYVTKYRECGTPYRVKVVVYRTVKVPVEKRIKIS